MDIDAVRQSYARWAPVYDHTFGAITQAGRRRAARFVNGLAGGTGPLRLLEVGVGTGLSLGRYRDGVRVTGIDASDDMLAKARTRVLDKKITGVEALEQMDARALTFPDASFDAVAALHIVSVVPEPERVIAEMARVLKPGGSLVIVNHFARETGALAMLEKAAAPFANLLGWHSDFDLARITGSPLLRIVRRDPLPPAGLMTFLVLERLPEREIA